jgi:hypothetical protein
MRFLRLFAYQSEGLLRLYEMSLIAGFIMCVGFFREIADTCLRIARIAVSVLQNSTGCISGQSQSRLPQDPKYIQ